MVEKIRRIQDRWLKEIPEFVAMRCKGKWVYFKRIYYTPFDIKKEIKTEENKNGKERKETKI